MMKYNFEFHNDSFFKEKTHKSLINADRSEYYLYLQKRNGLTPVCPDWQVEETRNLDQ